MCHNFHGPHETMYKAKLRFIKEMKNVYTKFYSAVSMINRVIAPETKKQMNDY